MLSEREQKMVDRFLELSYAELSGELALLAGFMCGLVSRLEEEKTVLQVKIGSDKPSAD